MNAHSNRCRVKKNKKTSGISNPLPIVIMDKVLLCLAFCNMTLRIRDCLSLYDSDVFHSARHSYNFPAKNPEYLAA